LLSIQPGAACARAASLVLLGFWLFYSDAACTALPACAPAPC
jgi:hypothetical protein